jgi:hypothetical protein
VFKLGRDSIKVSQPLTTTPTGSGSGIVSESSPEHDINKLKKRKNNRLLGFRICFIITIFIKINTTAPASLFYRAHTK